MRFFRDDEPRRVIQVSAFTSNDTATPPVSICRAVLMYTDANTHSVLDLGILTVMCLTRSTVAR